MTLEQQVKQHAMSCYESTTLTPHEEKEAILEAKKKKYFKQRSAEYWALLEKENPKA